MLQPDLLHDRSVIVTGAAQGLGRACARAVAAAGARVAVADKQAEAAMAVAGEITAAGGQAIAAVFDQSDRRSIAAMIEEAESRLGPISVLVNNAGLFSSLRRRPAVEIDPDEWDEVLRVNLTGPFLCARQVIPGMMERGYGKIINIVSASVFLATNQLAHYVSAKAGLVGLTRALAREYGASGICVNALSPGATDTGAAVVTAEYLERAASRRSIPRVEVPEDLTGALLFLCSSQSDFMTGQHLVVDGGSVFN
jgi:3-oxoacyl-[acyl-carrier protein] reductase